MTTQQRFTSVSAFFFTGRFIGAASRSIGGRPKRSVSFERGTFCGQRKCGDAGRAGRAGTTRFAERGGGRGDARRRSSRRTGVVRGRAGRLRSKRAPTPCASRLLKKVPRRANVSRAFGKNDTRRAFEARNGTGRPRRRDRARAGSGSLIAGRTSDTRVRLSFSVEAFISRAPRAVSVDPAVKRSSVPFPVRNPRVRRGPTMRLARASRVRSRFDTREGRRLAYLRDTRTRALPRSPPSVGTRCVVPAPSAREPVRSPAVVRSPRAFDRRSRSRSAVDRDRIGRKYLPARKNPNPLRFQKLSCAGRHRDSAQSGSSVRAFSIRRQPFFHDFSFGASVSRRLARRSTRGGCRADDRHANDPSALRSSVRAARDHGVDDAERRRPARGRDALARATRRHASRPARVAPRRAVRGGGGGPPGRADRDRADGRVPPEVRRRSNSGPPGARKDARSVPPPATPTHQTKPSSIFSDVEEFRRMNRKARRRRVSPLTKPTTSLHRTTPC